MDEFERAIDPFVVEAPLSRDVDLSRIGPYRGLGGMYQAISELRGRGARITIPARTRRGTPILKVEIGPGHARPTSVIIAGIHAMEWIGVEVALGLLDALCRRELGARKIVAFPVLNPDGVRRAEAVLRRGERMRFDRANDAGVDLNRNWPTHWRPTLWYQRALKFLGGAGEHPGSEPEVKAVLDALEAERARGGRLERALSLHSFGSMLLLPWGGRFSLPRQYPQLRANAERVQLALRSRYRITTSARWVPGAFAFGMELDHFLQEGMEPLLVECSRGGLSWADPGSWLVPFRWFNPRDPAAHTRELVDALLPFVENRVF